MLRKISGNTTQSELGFGRNMTMNGRLMNPDGSFNVERQNIGLWDNFYYNLITMPWWAFFALMFVAFGVLNTFFAACYCLIGIEQLNGIKPGSFWENFLSAYFFSSQTLTTVGYGHISPNGFVANLLASLESFTGLLIFALISGLLYGRFSRPGAKIVFSENILVAPYKNGQALMFRMGNALKDELVETEVQVILAVNQRDENGITARRFFPLELELKRISFFNLSWTIVHALSESSPLWGFSPEDISEGNAEFMVLVKGTEEANHQQVHTRHSYIAEEIVWNARFKPIIGRNRKGLPFVLTRQIGAYEEVV